MELTTTKPKSGTSFRWAGALEARGHKGPSADGAAGGHLVVVGDE